MGVCASLWHSWRGPDREHLERVQDLQNAYKAAVREASLLQPTRHRAAGPMTSLRLSTDVRMHVVLPYHIAQPESLRHRRGSLEDPQRWGLVDDPESPLRTMEFHSQKLIQALNYTARHTCESPSTR